MGVVLDFLAFRERSRTHLSGPQKQLDGVCVEAAPPFLVFRQFQAGVICQESWLLSERLLRELLDHIPGVD